MTHHLIAKQHLLLTTNLSLSELSRSLQGTQTTWNVRIFNPQRPDVFLLECENASHIQQRIDDLFLNDLVKIDDVTMLVEAVLDSAAAQAIVFVELLFRSGAKDIPGESSLKAHAQQIFHATCDTSQVVLGGNDYAGLERIFTRTFVEACYRTIKIVRPPDQ